MTFPSAATVSRVEVFNRLDCCKERLNGVSVQLISMDGSKVLAEKTIPNTSPEVAVLDFGGVANVGLIKLVKTSNGPLSVAEVQAFGQIEDSDSIKISDKMFRLPAPEPLLDFDAMKR